MRLPNSVFFILGAMLVILAGFAYIFDRAAFDFNFLLCGLCSITIGLLERRRESRKGEA